MKIGTQRPPLRQWNSSDVKEFFKVNKDPQVTRYLPVSLTMDEVEVFIEKQQQSLEKNKYCLWAAELKSTGNLIGFIGLNWTDFLKRVEIGWRLGYQY